MLDRPSPNCTRLIKNPVQTFSAASENIWLYNNALWRRKVSNAKILQTSANNGVTWTDLYTFTDYILLIVVTQDGSILVVTKVDTNAYVDPPAEVYRSSDAGVSFSLVKTFATGGVATFSSDVYQNTVYLGEYGKYNSLYVYKSADSGATWSTFFTHPVNGSATAHLHKVHIDNVTPTTVYISYGDSSPAEGLKYTTNGTDFSLISSTVQPTWLETDALYLYIGEDNKGKAYRILKSRLAEGAAAVEEIYDAQTDIRGVFGAESFYGGLVDAYGNLYFAGVSYGGGSSSNFLDSNLLVSPNHGDDWVMLKSYTHHAVNSTGPSFISKPDTNGRVYIKLNGSTTVELLDTKAINDRLISARHLFS